MGIKLNDNDLKRLLVALLFEYLHKLGFSIKAIKIGHSLASLSIKKVQLWYEPIN